ncbi:MAG TPA: ATP-dependent DNA helicase RecQ [Flavisolibacter sp.]
MTDTRDILQRFWGYDQFRPLQEEIITSVLQGKDTLAVLPTGGGKSICFQVPAMAQGGLCLVISPLIALMKDQVENLRKRGIPALAVHSGMTRKDVMRTLQNATGDYFKFLYLSPERLETNLFREYLPALNISLVAVDEAHCISQWGYDFRPSYLRIRELRNEIPRVPVLALTASATPQVQEDICVKLDFLTPAVYRQSFSRKNLSYSVFRPESKQARLTEILKKVPGCAIVYCRSRKRTQQVANLLSTQGIDAGFYHAGLGQEERNRRQQDWISNKTRVMVCTNAFGMGIDKPDVRLVIHADIPDCLENYYQEAGRAGRDGKKSYAVLLYEISDLRDLEQAHQVRYPSFERIRAVYHALVNFLQIPINSGQDTPYLFDFETFVRNFNLKPDEAIHALKALEQDGWLELQEKNLSPSTVVFTTRKEILYEFYKSHPALEPVCTTLLRTYEGIFDFPAFISENTLAQLLQTAETGVKSLLQQTAAFGIIRYIPRNEAPRIIFRKHRVAAEHLAFDLKQYNSRKDAFINRALHMKAYAEGHDCRSRTISAYFGEAAAPGCGICDNCLKKTSGSISAEEFKKIEKAIREFLRDRKATAEEILQHLRHTRKEKVWEVIRFLQSEQRLVADDEGILQLEISQPSE